MVRCCLALAFGSSRLSFVYFVPASFLLSMLYWRPFGVASYVRLSSACRVVFDVTQRRSRLFDQDPSFYQLPSFYQVLSFYQIPSFYQISSFDQVLSFSQLPSFYQVLSCAQFAL
uniref:Uncharacterized protein n=1 Tax=Cacopsylla melanoneura TaxID=428564 RepID=A0A8D8YMT6_9HEMI